MAELVTLKDGTGQPLPLAIFRDKDNARVGGFVPLVAGEPVGPDNPVPIEAPGLATEAEQAALKALVAQLVAATTGVVVARPSSGNHAQTELLISSGSTEVLLANPSRKFVMFINRGTGLINLSVGGSASIGHGIPLPPNGAMTFDTGMVPANAFYAIRESGPDSLLYILQG